VLTIGPAAEPPDKVEDKTVEQICDENNGEDFGKPVSNDEDNVVVPVASDDSENSVFVLRGHSLKVHHYYVSLSGSLNEDASDSLVVRCNSGCA
jgi:hypothetical protein